MPRPWNDVPPNRRVNQRERTHDARWRLSSTRQRREKTSPSSLLSFRPGIRYDRLIEPQRSWTNSPGLRWPPAPRIVEVRTTSRPLRT